MNKDEEIFNETDNETVEKEEEKIINSSESIDDIDKSLEIHDDNEDLNPEDFGIKIEENEKIYCDKKKLYEEIRKYQKENIASDELGEDIIKIALHMSTMARFWRYSHAIKEEIVEHAILQMLLSIPKFNLKDKKKNPFGYLSMICYRDMLHSLKRHFKQDKIRNEVSKVYIGKLSANNSSDDRLAMLRQTLEKNDEYKEFMNNDKYPYAQKQVDTFALSKKEQIRRYKESLKKNKKKSK